MVQVVLKKLVIVGNSGSGKSTLLNVYGVNQFSNRTIYNYLVVDVFKTVIIKALS